MTSATKRGRRRLLAKVPTPRRWIAIAAAAALLVVVGACSSSGTTSTAGSSGGGGSSGTLTVITGSLPDSLSPCDGSSAGSLPYVQLMFAPLVNADPQSGELSPGIASKWSFSGPNKLTFDLTIKDGLKFQDGTAVDAQAVVKSLEYCQQGKTQAQPNIKSITATGPMTVQIQLTKPTADLPADLSGRLGMIVSPTALQKYGKNIGTHPVGAGPYKLASMKANSDYKFVRYDGYKPAGPPAARMQTVDIQIIQDPTSFANALTSGRADLGWSLDTTNVKTFKADSNLKVELEPAVSFVAFQMNTSDKPIDNVNVRRAMEYALNRSALRDAAQNGSYGDLAWGPFPKGTPFYDPDAEDFYKYDPAKAKQLLAQAGFPNGVSMNGLVITEAPFTTNATIAAEQWKQVGINVKFDMSDSTSIPDFLNKNKAPIFSAGWSGTTTPWKTYSDLFGPESSYQQFAQHDPKIGSLLDQLASTYDQAGQLGIVKQLNHEILDQALIIPLYFTPDVVTHTTSVKGEFGSLIGQPNLAYIYKS